MSDAPLRITRRQVLAGLTTASVASAGVGAGLASFDDEQHAERDDAAGTMTVAVTGPEVEVAPPLVVAELVSGADGSHHVRVVNRSEVAARPGLQFRHEKAEGTDEHDVTGLHVDVAFGDEQLREGTFDRVFDGTVSTTDRVLAPGDDVRLTFDWRLPGDVAEVADAVVGVVQLRLGVAGADGGAP